MAKKSRRKLHSYRTQGANALADDPSILAAATVTATRRTNSNTPATTPPGGTPILSEFDPGAEYVAGAGLGYSALERLIPAEVRDAQAPEVTFETYRQMLNDPEVLSDVRVLVGMALAEGLQIVPAVDRQPVDEESPEFARAYEIAEFVQRNLHGLRKPLEKTLAGMVEGALAYGHKTAEITWRAGTGADANLSLIHI